LKDVFFFGTMTIVALWLQTTSVCLAIPSECKPDLFLILVYWTSLRLSFAIGIALCFGGGILVDSLSGSPMGLFALLYCMVFVSCGYLNTVFEIDTPMTRAVIILVAALASSGVVVSMRALASATDFGWNSALWVLAKASITSVVSLLIFPALDRFRMAYVNLIGER
jgi:rod shape-determining protein MreD